MLEKNHIPFLSRCATCGLSLSLSLYKLSFYLFSTKHHFFPLEVVSFHNLYKYILIITIFFGLYWFLSRTLVVIIFLVVLMFIKNSRFLSKIIVYMIKNNNNIYMYEICNENLICLGQKHWRLHLYPSKFVYNVFRGLYCNGSSWLESKIYLCLVGDESDGAPNNFSSQSSVRLKKINEIMTAALELLFKNIVHLALENAKKN